MNDPFELLAIYDAFEPAAISAAFAGALARGVPVMDARHAMDILRDPARRAAAEVLAPSMARAARRTRRATSAKVDDIAVDVVLRVLGAAVDDLELALRRSAVIPSRDYLIDAALPPLDEHLAP